MSLLTEGEIRMENERLARLNLELTEALARRGEELLAARAEIADLKKWRAEAASGLVRAGIAMGETVNQLTCATQALGQIAKLDTSQLASPEQCSAVVLAMDALEALKDTPPHPDTVRLDLLDSLRRPYSRPPMRAVTGTEWSVVSEGEATNVRAVLDEIRVTMGAKSEAEVSQ